MQSVTDQLAPIKASVADFIAAFDTEFAHALASQSRWLGQAIELLNKATGKQVRPLLIGLMSKACNHEPSAKTTEAAVLLELIHTATLIHDDVIDNSNLRRGHPTLNAIFDNRVAVLVGDFVLSSALMRAIELQDLRIISIISSIGRELSEGEIRQFEVADEVVLDEEIYYSVIKQKTATLFRAAAELAAISVDAEEGLISLCGQIGELLGYAFQIRDDIFDYYQQDIGKPTGNDIREGKVTLPLLYALNSSCAEKTEKEECLSLIKARSFDHENLDRLTRFAISAGGIEYANKRMRAFLSQANALIDTLPNKEAGLQLKQLAEFICNRSV